MDGAKAAEAGEETVGAGDVAGDLGAEFFGAGEFLFAAQALPEAHFDAGAGAEDGGLKVRRCI